MVKTTANFHLKWLCKNERDLTKAVFARRPSNTLAMLPLEFTLSGCMKRPSRYNACKKLTAHLQISLKGATETRTLAYVRALYKITCSI